MNPEKNRIFGKWLLSLMLVLLVFLGLLYFFEYLRSKESLARIAVLEEELESLAKRSDLQKSAISGLKKKLTRSQSQLNDVLAFRSGGPSRTTHTASSVDTAGDDGPGLEQHLEAAKRETERRARTLELVAGDKIARMEQFITLSKEQRARLAEKFKAELSSAVEFSEEEETESLEQILGSEMAQIYEDEKAKQEEQKRKDRLEQKLFSLGRKLSLTEEQEGLVRVALQEVENMIDGMSFEQYEAALQEQGKPESDAEDVVRWINQRNEQKLEQLNARLRDILTDEQYNKLLEEQVRSEPFVSVFNVQGR